MVVKLGLRRAKRCTTPKAQRSFLCVLSFAGLTFPNRMVRHPSFSTLRFASVDGRRRAEHGDSERGRIAVSQRFAMQHQASAGQLLKGGKRFLKTIRRRFKELGAASTFIRHACQRELFHSSRERQITNRRTNLRRRQLRSTPARACRPPFL